MIGIGSAERLAQFLATALQDLVRRLGSEPNILHCGEAQGSEVVAVSVEFGNDRVRCSLGLIGESRLFSRLSPPPKPDDPEYLTDWACELANQATGCLRNLVRVHGLALAARVPRISTVESVRPSAESRHHRIPIMVGIDDMVLEAWIDVDAPADLDINELPDERVATEMPASGDVLLF